MNNAPDVLETLAKLIPDEIQGLVHGTVSIEIHVRDEKPWRVTIAREKSILLDDRKGGAR